jgi:hypothetical protein
MSDDGRVAAMLDFAVASDFPNRGCQWLPTDLWFSSQGIVHGSVFRSWLTVSID